MIKTETVLILGAGASVDYGYLTGEELRVQIIGDLRSAGEGNGLGDALQASGFGEQLGNFRDQLENSPGFHSVDKFLERNDCFVEIGKAAMAWVTKPP
jgi:hypothetical protein